MKWEDLKIFDTAATSGSLSAGAKALGMSQPQISRRLRALEDEIGARLFDRTPQGLRPTPAGIKLMPLAEEMRKAAEVVERVKPDLATTSVTVVRISVDEIREAFLTEHLDKIIPSLNGIELEIFSGHEHLNHESRMTDIQIRSCLPDSETLIAKRLGQTGYGLYATEILAKQHNGKNLSTAPWIGISPDHLWYPLQKQWLEEVFDKSSTLRFNTMTAIANAARKGLGIALLPRFMAAKTDLVEIESPQPALNTVEYLIVHRDLLREKAVRKTIDAITLLYKSEKLKLSGE